VVGRSVWGAKIVSSVAAEEGIERPYISKAFCDKQKAHPEGDSNYAGVWSVFLGALSIDGA